MPRSLSAQRTQGAGRISSRNMMASLYFNGTNTSVMATKIPNLHLGCTFSAWFKYKTGSGAACIVENSQDTNNRLVMMYQSGLLRAGYWNGTAYTFKNSSWITPNTWYHGVFTWDGTNTKLYLNGVEQLLATQGPSSSQGGMMAIGMSGDGGGGRPFLGNIARVMLWNRALTQAEVASIYERGDAPSSGLAGKFDLNEGVGSIAYDTSGAGNNGTISNGLFTGDTAYLRRQPVNYNMVPNGELTYIPQVNVPQTVGNRWLDGTAGGSSTNTLFKFAAYNYTNSYEASFTTVSGINSIKLSTKAVNSSIGVGTHFGDAASAKLNNIPCQPNTTYTISGYITTNLVSGAASTGARISASQQAGDATTPSGSGRALGIISTTTPRTFYTGTFTTSATARYIKVDCSITGNDGAATLIMDAWFDSLVLTPTTPTARQVIS